MSDFDNLKDLDYEFYNQLINCTNASLSKAINNSLNVILDSIRIFGPNHVVTSFNGGKDAVVVMHLIRAAFAKYSYDKKKKYNANFIYFTVKNEFSEVLDFIDQSENSYKLSILKCDSGIVQGLNDYIHSFKKKKIIAISNDTNLNNSCLSKTDISDSEDDNICLAFVLGTRQGDPNCGDQQFFSPSSAWMPPFMRVNPILYWDYGQVWQFLNEFNLPYCSLYDMVIF